jgi:hypothetical protein
MDSPDADDHSPTRATPAHHPQTARTIESHAEHDQKAAAIWDRRITDPEKTIRACEQTIAAVERSRIPPPAASRLERSQRLSGPSSCTACSTRRFSLHGLKSITSTPGVRQKAMRMLYGRSPAVEDVFCMGLPLNEMLASHNLLVLAMAE